MILEDVFEIILERLVDFSVIPSQETRFIYADCEGTMYERLILNSRVTKPMLPIMEAECGAYEQEIYLAEQEAIVIAQQKAEELEESAEFKARINAIENIDGVIRSIYPEVSNTALKLKNILTEQDISALEALELEAPVIAEELEKAERKERLKALGVKTKTLCNDILCLVAGFNMDTELTTEEIDQMRSDLSLIETYLEKNRPFSAKPLIEALTGHDDLKTMALELYLEAGF